jgi:putative membrane protein
MVDPTRVFSNLANGAPMRFLCLLILIIVLAAFAVFAWQNQKSVTTQFLNWSTTCSLSVLLGIVYLVGMVSGWTVVAFLKRSFRRVTDRDVK